MTHKFATFIIKVLIGGDGVNSKVAKWLGFKKPSFAPRYAIRGYAVYEESHGVEHKLLQFLEKASNVVPFHVMITENEHIQSPIEVNEENELNDLVCSQLRYRAPWEILWADISSDNVCVVGNALHPMTHDLGQGACSALEDGVILARCIAEAFAKSSTEEKCSEEEEYERIKMSLKKYTKEGR
ncbi:hypothetical protein Ancab_028112 [Ancistrocladus abbreviatus]